MAGNFNGRYASFIFTYPGFALVDAWVADAPMNGSTLLLPTLASEIGLSAGSPTFQYAAGSFNLWNGDSDFVGFANFNAYSQPVSTGDYIGVGPGATVTDTLFIDRASLAISPVAGWLVQTMDDPSGVKQADVLKLTYTP